MRANGSLFIVLLTLMACSGDSEMNKYKKFVRNELASDKRVDSIFFGIHFGMTQKNFFTHCWEMNKKGLLTDGTDDLGNMYVLYKLQKELKYPAAMNFYPDFNADAIWKMRVNIHYEGWAPWNKNLYADQLLPDVLALYNKWYGSGNSFIQINDKEKGTIYVKVDGNRRITIGKYSDMIVKIDITDMLVEKKISK
jgi:hypothetical protein